VVFRVDPASRRSPQEAARQASRGATALADALEESLGATRRIAKQGGDTAEELVDDTIKRLQRHPVETVIATFSIGIATGITIGVATGICIGWMMKRRVNFCNSGGNPGRMCQNRFGGVFAISVLNPNVSRRHPSGRSSGILERVFSAPNSLRR
jgi:hypothetical protein